MRNRRSARLQRRCPTWRSIRCSADGTGVQHMHGVCVIDDDGAVVSDWMVEHTDEDDLGHCSPNSPSSADPASLPIAIERGEGLVVGLIAAGGSSGVDGRARRVQGGPSAMGIGRRQVRSSVMRSCSPTTPAPTVTVFDGSNRWRRPPGSSLRWSGPAPRWSRHAPRRRTSCGPCLPSIGPVLPLVFQKLTSQIALAFLTDYPTPQSPPCSVRDACASSAVATPTAAASPPPSWSDRLRAAPPARDPIAPLVLARSFAAQSLRSGLLNAEISQPRTADSQNALAAHPKAALLQTPPTCRQRQPRCS